MGETIVITNSQIQDLLNEIALHNCEKAYKKLFMEMHESLTAFAFSIVKSSEDAEEVISEQAIDALVRRLRERLAELDPGHAYVLTVRGHGFRFQNRAADSSTQPTTSVKS